MNERTDRGDLSCALNLITQSCPQAVRALLQTSDQDHYGFTLEGVLRADGSALPEPEMTALAEDVNPWLSSLNWGREVGEDSRGYAEIVIPAFTVGIAEFPHQRLTFFGYARRRDAEAAYESVDARTHRAVLYEGAPGYQVPERDTVVLVRLDPDETVTDLHRRLNLALRQAEAPTSVPGIPADLKADVRADLSVVWPSEIPDVARRNAIRARRVLPFLQQYADVVGLDRDSTQTVLNDLLTDLFHLTHLAGLTPARAVTAADQCFREEIAGEP